MDGVYVSLHGAMAALTEVDLEGHLLFEIRNILVGKETPLVVNMGPHVILTRHLSLAMPMRLHLSG